MSLQNICLKNEFLTVKINTLGAEMTSIQTPDGEEKLHQPDMVFWNGRAPVLFPVCGTPIGDKITVDGKEYSMNEHGFAKDSEFNLMECSDDLAVFSLVSNDETKKIYPYDFELIITYKLLGKAIDVSYEIINDSEEKMYFSIGSHEGYILLEGLSEYEIHFEKEESKKPYIFETRLCSDNHITSKDGHSILKLSDELFADSVTVVYENPDSDAVQLKNKAGETKIRVEFEEFDNLFIWSCPMSQFVCIEPWCGNAEFGEAPKDISEKDSIQALEAGEQFERHHIITVY
ncbi:MAG: aldose 1-epimerase family protein [Clostridia bacterium]|nr:aldose 1-epimerase family protein [Clostridia bacterium]